jgi:hypothetical protein
MKLILDRENQKAYIIDRVVIPAVDLIGMKPT